MRAAASYTGTRQADLRLPQEIHRCPARTPPVSAPALRHARLQLLDGRAPLAGAVREPLVHSWQRSMDAGLQPSGGHSGARHFAGRELTQVRDQNRELIDHSQPVMEYLFEQVRHNG